MARILTNRTLERMPEPHLKRPPGRPPLEGRRWLHERRSRAGTWERERRVVLAALERPRERGHLFLEDVFLLTNAPPGEVSAEELLRRFRGR